jgi:hypothetical protein
VQHTRVHDCGVHSQGRTKDESGVNREGIYVGSAKSKGVDRTGFVTLRANEIYATTDEGINIKEHTHHILIEHNVVYDLMTSDPGGINLRQVIGEHHTVRGNVVYHNQHFGLRVMFGSQVFANRLYGNGLGPVEMVEEPELR